MFSTDFPLLSHIVTTGVLLAHVAHFIAMVLIWSIASAIDHRRKQLHSAIAYVAAALYIFSPAGLFLSAPYAESLFASFSFLGIRLYISAFHHSEKRSLLSGAQNVVAGSMFGLATYTRSNGILAGLLYASDALVSSAQLLQGRLTQTQVIRFASVICGGILVGFGLVVPQYEAYTQYCTAVSVQESREWCSNLLPSIFTFVQAHYWCV